MALSEQDIRDMEEFDSAGRGRSNSGASLDFDFSEAASVGTVWPEGKHPLKSLRAERKIGKERYDEAKGTMVGGNPYIEVEWECLGGPMQGEKIIDRFPTKGKGTAKMVILGCACGIYDKEAQRLTVSKTEELVGLEVWGDVQTEKKEYQGRITERSVITFNGYEAIDTYQVPGRVEFEDEADFAPAAAVVAVDEEFEEDEEVPVVVAPKVKKAGAAGPTPPWPTKQ